MLICKPATRKPHDDYELVHDYLDTWVGSGLAKL